MPGLALVTTSYPDGVAGTEAAGAFVEDLAKTLSRSIPVSVVAAGRSASVTQDGDLTVRRFQVSRLPLSLLKPHKPWHWGAILSSLKAGNAALRDCLREDRPDHVLALWILPSGWWAKSQTRELGLPYSTWALGSDIWSLGKIPLVRGVLRRVLRAAEHSYADGLMLAKDVESISDEPCAFLPSGRNLPTISATATRKEPPYRLGFLGRWHPNKGADLLVSALEALSDDDWGRIDRVRVCGGGPLENRVREGLQRLARAGRPVDIGGYLDRDEAAELIGWADYLVLPSRIESIPVIFSDAAQLGTALISTPVGDLPDLHSRYEFGVMADAADTDALVEAIRRALGDDATRFDAGLAAAAKDFRVDAVAARLISELELN